MRHIAISAVLLLGLVNGCGALRSVMGGGGGDGLYEITVNESSYDRGRSGIATIRNASSGSLMYNTCPRRLERMVGVAWVAAYEWPGAGGACTLELRTLNRGTSTTASFELPAGVPSGTYRLVFTGLGGPDGSILTVEQQASRTFDVR